MYRIDTYHGRRFGYRPMVGEKIERQRFAQIGQSGLVAPGGNAGKIIGHVGRQPFDLRQTARKVHRVLAAAAAASRSPCRSRAPGREPRESRAVPSESAPCCARRMAKTVSFIVLWWIIMSTKAIHEESPCPI